MCMTIVHAYSLVVMVDVILPATIHQHSFYAAVA